MVDALVDTSVIVDVLRNHPPAVKQAGKMHLEGKDYVVKDGDIVHIRHSS